MVARKALIFSHLYTILLVSNYLIANKISSFLAQIHFEQLALATLSRTDISND